MSRRLLVAGFLLALLGTPAGEATADPGDPPTGPEACVVEELNQRRDTGALEWSGSVRDELVEHAASMAERGELDHAAMSVRVAGLPDGWSGYGETSYAASLPRIEVSAVEEWCRNVLDVFWNSVSHRQVLVDAAYDLVAVGTHWDGERMWVAVGVFAHPDFRPVGVDWPDSYVDGLKGAWEGHFYDDDGSVFQPDIERLAASGLTRGCNPPDNTRFCPTSTVTRGEMAAFLARAFGWSAQGGDHFTDDDTSVFEQNIEALFARGVTEGCNPPAGDRFCPDRAVTRAEMATFLGRALGLEPLAKDRFGDTATSIHEGYINAVAEAGITRGCDSAGTRYCPERFLSRAQMAAFLVRAGLGG